MGKIVSVYSWSTEYTWRRLEYVNVNWVRSSHVSGCGYFVIMFAQRRATAGIGVHF